MLRASRLLFCAVGMSCLAIAAHAQTYPSQPVSVITPYQAGGGLDMNCRTIAERSGERLGQPATLPYGPERDFAAGSSRSR